MDDMKVWRVLILLGAGIASAAVEMPPRELIIDAKATYPREVPNRCSRLGKATLTQGNMGKTP